MKKSTIALTAITLTLTSALAACQNGGPDPTITGEDEPLQTARVIGIRPAETRDPNEPLTFPSETYPVVGPDTDIDPNIGVVPPISPVTREGRVFAVPYLGDRGGPPEDLLGVVLVTPYSYTRMVLHTAYADRYNLGDRVTVTYDEGQGPTKYVTEYGDTYTVREALDVSPLNSKIYTYTMHGTVAEPPYDWMVMDDQMLAIRIWYDGAERFMVVHTEKAADFCPGDEVFVEYGPTAEPWDTYGNIPVWDALQIGYIEIAVSEKPVIYLYPETPTQVSVELTLDGKLTCTYPAYGDGWHDFTAHPDGTLYGPDGREYYCLYWEGVQNTEWDFSEGFCVRGSDTAAFLEWALSELGLTPREANEFIIYWLPRMEGNPYNVISFQTEAYTDTAVLTVTPTPDTLLRVFMAWYPSDLQVDMVPQALETTHRQGFTVVEWGGSEVGRP